MLKKGKIKFLTAVLGAALALTPFSTAFAANDVTTGWDSTKVTIVNNAGIPDTVKVTGIPAGAIVKVYSKSEGGKLIGSAKAVVPKGGSEPIAIVSIADFSKSVTGIAADIGKAGNLYISVVLETAVKEFSYEEEKLTTPVDKNNVTIANNVRKSDTITVTGLTYGTIVKAYSTTTNKVVGSLTLPKDKTSGVISVAQLGSVTGSVYLTTKVVGLKESDKVSVDFAAEPVTTAPDANTITVVNNAGIADTIKVTGLTAGDIVKVNKKDAATIKGSATVATGKTEALVSIGQLGAEAGAVEVTVTSKDKLESAKTEKAFVAEAQTAAVDASQITVENNFGKADAVTVTGLTYGTTVKVYKKAEGTEVWSTTTLSATATEAKISIAQLGTVTGSVYVTTKEKGKTESVRVEKTYAAEPKTDAPQASNITVTNNKVGTKDTIKVTGLTASDVVKVYLKGSTTVIGTATATGTEVTISVTQLGTTAGNIEVTVQSKGKSVSDKTEKAFDAEV